uniref:G-protein coupled receptors family 1 profile domain-containing protein n=1 Tax=Plectus sambesii TaxID=2011161 RepID=A0A914W5C8_9BILA
MCDAACITGWATTVYSLVTIPFYVLFLCMIIYHRKTPEFNHAFFKILISLSVADIVQLIVALFFNQFLVFHGWVSNFCQNFLGDLGAHLGTLLLWGTAMAQHLNVVSMAFNRYTAYVHPLKFNQLWMEKRTIIVAVGLPWLLSCVYVIPMANMPHFFYESENVTYLSWRDSRQLQTYYNCLITIIIIIAILLIFLYGNIFVTALKQFTKVKNEMKNSPNDKIKYQSALLALKITVCGSMIALGRFICSF